MTGSSVYPSALDSLSTVRVSGDVIQAATDNDEADAINKIELELGINPAGTYTDVVTRLDTADTELGTNPSGVYTDVTTRLGTLETLSFNPQTGTTYTLVLADATLCVVITNASAITLTVPTNASVAFLSGTEIRLRQGGAGAITVVGAGGVTIVNPYNSFVLAGLNAEAKLLKIGTNAWSLNGEVV